jgi:hypothetical protein
MQDIIFKNYGVLDYFLPFGYDSICSLEGSYSQAGKLQSLSELVKGWDAWVLRIRLDWIMLVLMYSSPEGHQLRAWMIC